MDRYFHFFDSLLNFGDTDSDHPVCELSHITETKLIKI